MTIIDLSMMKAKALNFPDPVKSLILSEPDKMDSDEFLAKVGTWDRLLEMQMEVKK